MQVGWCEVEPAAEAAAEALDVRARRTAHPQRERAGARAAAVGQPLVRPCGDCGGEQPATPGARRAGGAAQDGEAHTRRDVPAGRVDVWLAAGSADLDIDLAVGAAWQEPEQLLELGCVDEVMTSLRRGRLTA